jgi:hypothetical protein
MDAGTTAARPCHRGGACDIALRTNIRRVHPEEPAVSLAYPGSGPRRAGSPFMRYGEAERLHPRRQVGDGALRGIAPRTNMPARLCVLPWRYDSDCGWTWSAN